MCDSRKTKKALIEELQTLRSRLAELERVEDEHKRPEAALRESEQRYARAEQIGHFGHFERDLVEDKAIWSRESYRLFGVDPDQFEPSYENFLNLVHPADREPLNSAMHAAISHGKPLDIEYRIVRPDGTERVLHSVAEVRFDKSGRPMKLVGTALDITERKQAEQVLRKARDELEARVQERTATLSRTNELLKEQIAEHERAEEAVRLSEATAASKKALLDNIITNIPACVFWKDKHSVYLGCNDNFAELAGLKKPEDIVGKTDYDLPWRKSESDFYRKIDKEVMRNGVPQLNFEEPVHLTDGTAATILTSKVPLRNADGVVEGILGIFWDITDRKRVEQDLIQSEEKYRSVVESIGIGVSLISPNMEILALNRQLREWFPDIDVSKKPVCYKTFNKPPRQDVCSYCPTCKSLKDGQVHESVTQTPAGDKIVNYRIVSSPVKDKDGKVIAAIEMVEDITEQKRAEEALRESEERHKALFQGAAEGIVVAEVETKMFIYANPAICRMLGYTEQELTQMGVHDIHTKEDLEHVISEFEAQARGEKTLSLGIPCLRKDGTIIYADINTAKVVIAARECNVGFFTDITERKKAEDELQKARDELEIRVEQRTADLAKAIEELRNEIAERKKAEEKLRSLHSELSLAEERLRRRLATDVHDHIGQNLAISKIKLESLRDSVHLPEVAESLDEISELVGETIQSTRSLTFELSPPVLYELGFEAAVEWLVRQARQRHGLSTEFKNDGRVKPLEHDVRVLLFQAVRELLVNVAKHANAHSVTVSTRRVGDQIEVSVEDDGVGFDTSEVGSRAYKTGGFGLFSIRERLGLIGGRLDVESKLDTGTRVTLVAPIDHGNKTGKEKQK